MLSKLLTDVTQLGVDIPLLQTAITAIEADTADPHDIDDDKLATDANALQVAAAAVALDVQAVTADLSVLPAAEGMGFTFNKCRLATLGVMGLELAAAFGLTVPPEVLPSPKRPKPQRAALPLPPDPSERTVIE